jgi:hypothetical protein
MTPGLLGSDVACCETAIPEKNELSFVASNSMANATPWSSNNGLARVGLSFEPNPFRVGRKSAPIVLVPSNMGFCLPIIFSGTIRMEEIPYRLMHARAGWQVPFQSASAARVLWLAFFLHHCPDRRVSVFEDGTIFGQSCRRCATVSTRAAKSKRFGGYVVATVYKNVKCSALCNRSRPSIIKPNPQCRLHSCCLAEGRGRARKKINNNEAAGVSSSKQSSMRGARIRRGLSFFPIKSQHFFSKIDSLK